MILGLTTSRTDKVCIWWKLRNKLAYFLFTRRFLCVPTTYVFMEKWRKLSIHYHQIPSLSVPLSQLINIMYRKNSKRSDTWKKCWTYIWATSWENLLCAICEQQRRRSACASAQSDQHLCCSLPRYYNTSSFYIRNFKPLPSFCGCRFVSSYLAVNPEDRFSPDVAHI